MEIKSFVDITPEEYSQYDKKLNEIKDEILKNLNSEEWVFSQEVDDGCKIEFNRSAISTVLKSEAELAKEKEEAAQKKSIFGFGKKKTQSSPAAEAPKAEETAKTEETKSEEVPASESESDENK